MGALEQYWTVDEKPRLYRKNTWLEDHEPQTVNLNAFLFIGVFSVMAFVVFAILEAMF